MTGRNCPACRRWLPRFAGGHPRCVAVPSSYRTSNRAFMAWLRSVLDLAPIPGPGVGWER